MERRTSGTEDGRLRHSGCTRMQKLKLVILQRDLSNEQRRLCVRRCSFDGPHSLFVMFGSLGAESAAHEADVGI